MAATPKEKFEAAVNVIHSLPKHGSFQPSYAMMLSFYGLYKQATLGPCNISKPGFWDVIGKAKWDAWHRLGQMQQEVAMTQYVEELKKAIKRMSKDHAIKNGHSRKKVQLLFDGDPTGNFDKLSDADWKLMEKIIETMPHTDNVQEFVERLGDFYEVVEDDTPIAQMVRNASPKNNSVAGQTHAATRNGIGQHDGRDESGNASSSNSTGSSPLRVSPTASLDASHSTSAAAAAGRRVNGPGEPTSDSGSDAEEFCDTSDVSHLQDDTVIRMSSSVLSSDPTLRLSNFDSASQSLPITGTTPQLSSRTTTGVSVSRPRPVDRVTVDGSQPTTTTTEVTTTDPLVLALSRLQQDMNSALVRLQAMETLFMAQKEALEKTRFNQRKPNKWRLFAGVNYPTIAFLISWPIVVHVVVRYMTRKRN